MDFDTKKLKVMGAMRDADILESFDILQDDNDAHVYNLHNKLMILVQSV